MDGGMIKMQLQMRIINENWARLLKVTA